MSKFGRYRYWGDQKPDAGRPLLTFSRASEAVTAKVQSAPAAAPASQATLRIYGPIDSYGGYWGVSAKEVAQALDLLGDVDQIVVRVNSPGGESSEGRAIMNLLRAHKAKCISVVDGAAYSAASYIAVGCDESVMAPGTTLMIHDTSAFLYGNADALRKEADVLELISTSGAELYAEVTGGTVEAWRELQRAETWYTASTAVAAGLIDRVGIVADSGPAETAGDDGPESVDSGDVEERARAAYDLSLFDRAPEALSTKPPTASAGGTPETEGGSAVALSDEQITMRQKLGIAEDADEATTLAALEEALDERAEPPAESTTPKVPEGMSLVDTALLEQLQSGATAGTAALAAQAVAERDRVINQALSDGKIAASSKDKFVEEYDKNPSGTKVLLDALTPGVVPVAEIGHGDQPDDGDQAFEAAHAAVLAKHGITKEG